jgi:hypothetical protein
LVTKWKLPSALRDANLFGIQTAAIAAGGNSAGPSVATNVKNMMDLLGQQQEMIILQQDWLLLLELKQQDFSWWL